MYVIAGTAANFVSGPVFWAPNGIGMCFTNSALSAAKKFASREEATKKAAELVLAGPGCKCRFEDVRVMEIDGDIFER